MPSLHVLDGKRLDEYSHKSQQRAAITTIETTSSRPAKRTVEIDDPAPTQQVLQSQAAVPKPHSTTKKHDEPEFKPKRQHLDNAEAVIDAPKSKNKAHVVHKNVEPKHGGFVSSRKAASQPVVEPGEETTKTKKQHKHKHHETDDSSLQPSNAVEKASEPVADGDDGEGRSAKAKKTKKDKKSQLVVSKPEEEARVQSGAVAVIHVRKAKDHTQQQPLPWEQAVQTAVAGWD